MNAQSLFGEQFTLISVHLSEDRALVNFPRAEQEADAGVAGAVFSRTYPARPAVRCVCAAGSLSEGASGRDGGQVIGLIKGKVAQSSGNCGANDCSGNEQKQQENEGSMIESQ